MRRELPLRVSHTDPLSAESPAVEAARLRHAAALRSYALELLHGDRARSEEVLAATWQAWARESAPAGAERGAAWPFAELRRRAMLLQREVAAPVEEDAGDAQEDDTAESRFALLTLKQREALRLKFLHGFRHEEIAGIVDLGPTQAARLLHNALGRLAPAFRVSEAGGTLGTDDPRLTLAALGELEDAAWRAWEAGQGNPAAANVRMEEIRRAARWVTAHFASGGHQRTKRARRWSRWWPGLVAAGVLVLGLGYFAIRSKPAQPDPPNEPAAQTRERGFPSASAPAVPRRAGSDVDVAAAEKRVSGPEAESLGLFRDRPREGTSGHILEAGESLPPGPALTAGEDSRRNVAPSRAPLAVSRGRQGGAATAAPEATGRGVTRELSNSEVASEHASLTSPLPGSAASSNVGTESRPASQTPAGPAAHAARDEMAAVAVAHDALQASTAGAAETLDSTDVAPITALKQALGEGRWPSAEEVNRAGLKQYFARCAPVAPGAAGFEPSVEAAELPWSSGRVAVRFAATARPRSPVLRAAANVILLLDSSGSMDAPNRLPLVQAAVAQLLDRLQAEDRIGIVTYAGEAQVLLAPRLLGETRELRERVQALVPRGQTNGGAGLEQAFALAMQDENVAGTPRVILCTDGEFNMGLTREDELEALVRRHAEAGVRLAVFGFGRSERIDPRLERLAALAQGGSGFVNTRADAVAVMLTQLGDLIAPAAEAVELRVEVGGAGRDAVVVDKVLPGETVSIWSAVEPGENARARLTYRAGSPAEPGGATLDWDGRVLPVEETGAEFRFEAAVERLADLFAAGAQGSTRAQWEQLEAWGRQCVDDPGGYRAELLALIAQARAARGEDE